MCGVCVCVCVCVCVWLCLCVCVCEGETEIKRESERKIGGDRQKERERERERERKKECVSVRCMCGQIVICLVVDEGEEDGRVEVLAGHEAPLERLLPEVEAAHCPALHAAPAQDGSVI